jgi:hypothetical protein
MKFGAQPTYMIMKKILRYILDRIHLFRVPAGRSDNSPALQCRDNRGVELRPEGTIEDTRCADDRLHLLRRAHSGVPSGRNVFAREPGTQVPGYYRGVPSGTLNGYGIRKGPVLALLLGLALFAGAPDSSAASGNPPDLMTYQGYLVDVNGAALAPSAPANYPIVFRIYDASTGGNILWSEQQIVTVDKGNFSVVLGEGTAVSGEDRPALSNAFIGANSSERYLGITVTISGTTMTLSPRLRLLPAPYAFAATKAMSIDSSAVVRASALGSATSVTTHEQGAWLEWNKDSGSGMTYLLNQKGFGLGGIVFGEVSSADAITERMRIDSNGNVGIGTTSPTTMLQIGEGENRGPGGLKINTGWVNTANFAEHRPFDVQVQGDSKLVVNTQGNVGIGTTTPDHRLQVIGEGSNLASFSSTGASGLLRVWDNTGFANRIELASRGNGRAAIWSNGDHLNVLRNGRVGIGTTDPTQAKLVVSGTGGTENFGNHMTLDSPGLSGPHGGSYSRTDVSIKGTHAIHAAYFRALSDARIKNVQGHSAGSADLETLNRIEIVDYVYKDVVSQGDRPQKKVLGQQVEQVFPQAVVTSADVVPDIYRKATVHNGWVDLATNLKVGERVRLISKTEEGIHEVLEVTPDGFRAEFDPKGDEVFVYGREVNDFRVVDYEAISMLNVSATQELARRVESLESREARVAELEKKAAKVDALEQEIAKLQKLVADLASATKDFAKPVAKVSSVDGPTAARVD